jgi:hypothetical protein
MPNGLLRGLSQTPGANRTFKQQFGERGHPLICHKENPELTGEWVSCPHVNEQVVKNWADSIFIG